MRPAMLCQTRYIYIYMYMFAQLTLHFTSVWICFCTISVSLNKPLLTVSRFNRPWPPRTKSVFVSPKAVARETRYSEYFHILNPCAWTRFERQNLRIPTTWRRIKNSIGIFHRHHVPSDILVTVSTLGFCARNFNAAPADPSRIIMCTTIRALYTMVHVDSRMRY